MFNLNLPTLTLKLIFHWLNLGFDVFLRIFQFWPLAKNLENTLDPSKRRSKRKLGFLAGNTGFATNSNYKIFHWRFNRFFNSFRYHQKVTRLIRTQFSNFWHFSQNRFTFWILPSLYLISRIGTLNIVFRGLSVLMSTDITWQAWFLLYFYYIQCTNCDDIVTDLIRY